LVHALLAAPSNEPSIARLNLERVLDQYDSALRADDDLFGSVLVAALNASKLDAASDLIGRKFGKAVRFELEFGDTGHPEVLLWQVVSRRRSKLRLSSRLREAGVVRSSAMRLVGVMPLLYAYNANDACETGQSPINIGDHGYVPGLAFSDNRPDYFLIPDAIFLINKGYEWLRHKFNVDDVAWDQRTPIGFWRGGTSGWPTDPALGWRSLPRIQLCKFGQTHPELIDAGISYAVQSATDEEIQAAGLMRPIVPMEAFNRYKYQIDIDGNTNSWPGLFQKLLSGSPVLKIKSRDGYRQWYYDQLKPWVNFVPVASDMSDLVEKILWLRSHDEEARTIGEAGKKLAHSLDYHGEIGRSSRTINAAFRYFAGNPEMSFRFGEQESDNRFLTAGWGCPGVDSVPAITSASRIVVPRPVARFDYDLSLEVSPLLKPPAAPAQELGVVVNEELVLKQELVERTIVKVNIPHELLEDCGDLDITLLCPCAVAPASADRPSDDRVAGIAVHAVTLAAAEKGGATVPLAPLASLPPTEAVQPIYLLTHHGRVVGANAAGDLLQLDPTQRERRRFLDVGDLGDGQLIEFGVLAGFTVRRRQNTVCFERDGLFLCAELSGGLVADRSVAGPWETFVLVSAKTLERRSTTAVRTWTFGLDGAGVSLLHDGWWGAEGWGQWASQNGASLKIPIGGERQGDISLRLELMLPPRWEGRPRGLIFVRVNGEEVFAAFDNGPRIFTVRTPGSLWRRTDPAIVSLATDLLQNPARAGRSGDSRDLGVGLISCSVEPIDRAECADAAGLEPPADVKDSLDALPEDVRLVVWDLDETFWRGTLAEDGARFVADHKAIVIELASRGIVSSICSKNDIGDVRAALEPTGLLSYFVFPQIDWQPKGPKLAKLVDRVQLRPSTILFIDDNPLNRNEAKHFVPDMQVVDERVIPFLLRHPRFKGRADMDLARLQQYRVLETRARGEANGGGDTAQFLRRSNIRVCIEHDIRSHVDRAVELINRTNQLNFTKRRLPEDTAEAARALLEIVDGCYIQAGLVRVEDNYGDYGFVGLYVFQQTVHPGTGLLHFCFSCRTLGMSIETWLYRKLGRPPIEIRGDVVSDILDERITIDWIHEVAASNGATGTEIDTARHGNRPAIMLRGGCELMPIGHYCTQLARRVIGEYAFNRDEIQVRVEHSIMLRHAIEGFSVEQLEAAKRLGFRTEDFQTRLFDDCDDESIWVLSFWADAIRNLYRHKSLGLLLPFDAFPAARPGVGDLTQCSAEDINPSFRSHWISAAVDELRENYECVGLSDEELFKQNVRAALSSIPSKARVFMLGANEQFRPSGQMEARHYPHQARMNEWCRDIVAEFSHVRFIEASEYIVDESELEDVNHFSRMVYFRIFEIIARDAATWRTRHLTCAPV
jgi:FkbH-like protein